MVCSSRPGSISLMQYSSQHNIKTLMAENVGIPLDTINIIHYHNVTYILRNNKIKTNKILGVNSTIRIFKEKYTCTIYNTHWFVVQENMLRIYLHLIQTSLYQIQTLIQSGNTNQRVSVNKLLKNPVSLVDIGTLMLVFCVIA